MEIFRIKGGTRLSGEIEVSSAKNSILPIIVAATLCDGECVIEKFPMLEDVIVICDVLRSLNVNICIDEENELLKINSQNINSYIPSEDLIRKMRASFLISGALLARFGQAKIYMPGGCNIGIRPIDLHLKGLASLGAEINIEGGVIDIKAKELKGGNVYLDFPSVGATENIIIASIFAKGTTVIENAAREPEIVDLCLFINKMGGNIKGYGTSKIIVEGVDFLKGVRYRPIYDRIEAGTYIALAAMTKSKITIKGTNEEYLKSILLKFYEMGLNISIYSDYIFIDGDCDLKPIKISTHPHPGFPTDMQSQMMTLLSIVRGTSTIIENIFENRFMHVMELLKMGANINSHGRISVIEGVSNLSPSRVKATDLRAGASLIIAGLSCDGDTEIRDIYHIDRGYSRIEKKLSKINANIQRIVE